MDESGDAPRRGDRLVGEEGFLEAADPVGEGKAWLVATHRSGTWMRGRALALKIITRVSRVSLTSWMRFHTRETLLVATGTYLTFWTTGAAGGAALASWVPDEVLAVREPVAQPEEILGKLVVVVTG